LPLLHSVIQSTLVYLQFFGNLTDRVTRLDYELNSFRLELRRRLSPLLGLETILSLEGNMPKILVTLPGSILVSIPELDVVRGPHHGFKCSGGNVVLTSAVRASSITS